VNSSFVHINSDYTNEKSHNTTIGMMYERDFGRLPSSQHISNRNITDEAQTR